MKEQNGGITIAEGMIEGFRKIERWSVTKQGLLGDVQESYTSHATIEFILEERAVPNKKGNGKRELIDTGTDKRYVRRDAEGQFKESDDQGRSLARDVKQHAKTTVKSGQGDRGDQKRK
jgi:hypothetical protein